MTKDGCFKVANYTSLKKKTTISDGSTLSANNVNLGGGFEYKPYQPSEAVTQAQTMLQQQVGAKPGPYTSQWEGQLNAIMDRINNRQPFKYDLNGDAIYNQYKNQYVQQGRMAMMDTMGQAAALTGGYGNSYAQGVGQQAYQGYLQQLNDRIPELFQLALDQYDREGQDLYTRYGLISDRENTDYGRYQDGHNAWLNERDYLAGRYDAERDYDYGMYADDRDFTYGQHRDSVADQQWQMQFDEALRQYEEGKKKSSGGTRVVYKTKDEPSARQAEIIDWLDAAIDNANGPSFDPQKLIAGTSFLKDESERAYARDVLAQMHQLDVEKATKKSK